MILATLASMLQDAGTQPAGAPQGAPPQGGMLEQLGGMLPPILMIGALFYFMMWAPEKKQRKLRAGMLASLKKGDKVITTGGMYGTIVQIQDQVVTLQVADGLRIRMALSAIQSIEADSGASVVEAK